MVANLMEHPIYSKSVDCQKQFRLLHGKWATDQLFRFNLWTANSGVLVRSSAGMDWRLRDSPDLQIMITELLEVLERHLSRMFPQHLMACLREEIVCDNILVY